MSTTLAPSPRSHPVITPFRGQVRVRVLARATDRLLDAVAPNWFAAVMGTGIVAAAAVVLPAPVASALRPAALTV
jgi:hypothetical protein